MLKTSGINFKNRQKNIGPYESIQIGGLQRTSRFQIENEEEVKVSYKIILALSSIG